MTALSTLLLALPAAQAGGSGAAVGKEAVSGSALLQREPERAAPEHCPSARRAIRFYAKREREWRARMGAGPARPTLGSSGTGRYTSPLPCPQLHRLALRAQARARAARRAFVRWHHYHYAWREWLPPKWQRIGACETGYGRPPGDWRWNSGTYEGAFGFYFGTWDAYKPAGAPHAAYLATPRQQYQAALNVYRVHGYGAWGCGGA